MKKPYLFLVLFFLAVSCFCQEGSTNLVSGVITINHSLKINGRNQLKSSYERRLPLALSDPNFFSGTVVSRNDFTVGLQRKLSPMYSYAVGGMYRLSEGGNGQRLFQQISCVQQTLTRVKLAHRLRLDETFSARAPEYRFRYRVGAELPSRGFKTDPGETYIAFLSEALAKFQGGEFLPELRVATQFGYLFKNGNKGELLLDLRMENPGETSETIFLIGVGYYFSK